MSNTFKPNPSQQKAIESRNKNVIVSASAGSGKTALLIERLTRRIIDDRISIDQIVAMTFTEKAAAEMKNRLARSLSLAYKNNPNDAFLAKQLELLPSAQISTIHSFCLKIIKEFGYLLAINPESTQNIFEDRDIYYIQNKAKDETNHHLMDKYHHSELFINLLNYFGYRIYDFENFSNAYMNLYEIAQVQLDPKGYYNEVLRTYDSTSFNTYPQTIKNLILNYLVTIVDDSIEELKGIFDLFDLNPKQHADFYDWLVQQENLLPQIRQSLIDGNFDLAKELTKQLFSTPYQTRRIDYASARTKLINGNYNKLAKFFLSPEDLTDLKPMVEILIEAAKHYGNLFTQYKKELRGLDFNDIEHYAYQILKHENPIARETYRNQFKEIMIDEFQDTNNYQNEISTLISSGNNLFRVGDVKQSIYGFRNARPEIMMNIIKSEDENNETINLTNNYRSSENIIEFGNLLFKNLMNIEGSAMKYEETDVVSIGLEKQKEIDEPVEIHLIDKEQLVHYQDPNGILSKDYKISSSALKVAYYIAQDIKRRKTKDNQLQFKDFTILIRTHARKRELKKAFEDEGIPFYIEDTEGFYHSYSVQDISHFVKFIYNPRDNISLFWVLQSGFINLTENELAALKLKFKTDILYDKLKEVYPNLYTRLSNFINLIQNLNDMDKLLTLLSFNNYYQEHLSTQERTNIDLLIQHLHTYLKKENSGLLGFVKEIDVNLDTKTSTAMSVSEDDDVVKVHTVHQSKGLEYPVTYFFANRKDNVDQDTKSSFIVHDTGLAMKLPDFNTLTTQTNLLREGIKVQKQYDNIHEEIRNLYVTLTRAKNKLIIVDTDEEVSEDELTLAKLLAGENYMKLILRALQNEDNSTFEIHQNMKIEPIISQIKRESHSIKDEIKADLITSEEVIEPLDPQEFSLSLNLQTQQAMQYGTLLHELIATNQSSDDPDIQSKLNSFKQHPFTLELMNYPHTHEVPIAYKQDDNIVYGYIDLLVEKDNEIIMVDYKSDQVQNKQQLLTRYQPQMMMYLEGLKLVYPTLPITQYLYSFTLNEFIKV